MLPPAPLKKTEESSGLSLLPPPPKKEVSQPSIKAGNRLRTDTSQPEQAPTTEGLKQDIQGALTNPVKPINPFRGNFTPPVKEENKFGMQSPEKSRQVQRDSDVAVMEYENIKNKTKGLVEDLSFDPEKEAERKQMAETSPDQFGQMARAEDKQAEETALAVQEQRLDKEARTFDQLPIEKEIDKLPEVTAYPPRKPDEDFATWKEGYIQNERAQKDAYIDAATKDYFQYLKWIRPQDYDYEKSKYESIMSKPKEEWDEKDQEYIRDFRADAIAINARAVNTKLNDLEKTYNFDEYNRRMVEMGPEIDQLNAQIKTTAPDDPNYPALVQKAEQLQMFMNEVAQSTGVTDEAILEYGKLAGASKNLNRVYVYEKHKGDYSKALDDEFSKEVVRGEEYEKMMKEGFSTGKLANEAVGSFGQSAASIPQVLKVFGDMTGDTDYDIFDRMYDEIQYGKDLRTGSTFGEPVNQKDTYKNLPTGAKIALTGGNAIGSMASFMLGGTAAGGLAKGLGATLNGVQIAQRAGTFTTAFLTTQPSYYQEAVEAGMNRQDAAETATILATLTAGAEMIVNDAAYLTGGSFRGAIKTAMAKGLTSKEATKAVGNAIIQTTKSAIKEGGEEVFQQVVEDVTKQQTNLQHGIDYFNNTFDPETYEKAALGGFIAGGGMKAIASSGSQHPDTEQIMLELARAQSLEVAAMYDPEILEMATPIITRLQENLQGLESHSNWSELSYDEQAHALALTNQINNIEEEQAKMKTVRVKDQAKDEQIAAIEAELNDLFNAPKPKQEAKTEPVVAEDGSYADEDGNTQYIPPLLPETAAQEDVSKKEEKIDVTEERVDQTDALEWVETPKSKNGAALSSKGDYVISHRPNNFTVSFRPEGVHENVGSFKTIEEAKAKVDELLAPKTTTGTEAPVATKTGETVAPINLPPTVVEQGEDTTVVPQPEVKKGKNSAKAQAARERAEAIRKATGGTNMIAPKLYAAALDVYADLLDTFDTVAEAIKEFRKTKEYQALEQGDRDEIENEIAEETDGGERKKKSLLNRANEGTAPQDIKDSIQRHGLDYEVEKQADAKKAAQKFIEDVGVEAAVQAVRESKVDDAAAAYVWAEAIDLVGEEIVNETDPNTIKKLQDLEAELIDEFDRKARSGGRFISALGDIYKNSKFGYSLGRMKARYKEANSGVLPADVEARIEEYDKKIRDLEQKIQDEAKRADEAEDTIVSIKEAYERENKTYAKRAKQTADKFREKFKTKPLVIRDAQGNEITIKTQGFTWNDVVEVAAKAIEKTGKIADGVKAALDYLQNQDWYKNLTDEERTAINDQIADQLGDNIEGLRIPKSEVQEIVVNGAKNITEVVDELKKKYPEYSEREIRDAVTGYGREVGKTQDQVTAEINRMKEVGRMMSKLEDLKNRINRERNTVKRAKLTDDEKKLRREINDLVRDLGFKDAAKLEQAKQRIEEKIKEMQQRMANKDFSKRKTRPVVADTELIRLRAEQQRIKDQYDTELHRAELDNRTMRVKAEDAAIEIWGLTRALMATGEMSFVLIQGGIQTLAHPVNASRAFLKALQHGWSESKAEKWGQFIKSQEWYSTMQNSKLSLSEYDARLQAREEQFLGGWINKIWDIAGYAVKGSVRAMGGDKATANEAYEAWKAVNPIKAIERAGVGYLNTLRVLRFLDGMYILEKDGKTFENNPEDYKNVADAINTLTGRGKTGLEGNKNMQKILPLLFFSPKNWASQLKTSTPLALYHFGKMGYKDGTYKPSAAQKMAMSDFMKFVSITGAMVALAAAHYNNDDDDETEVNLDPTSTDFMKIRIGDTRIDPWGGRMQNVVFQSRFIIGAMRRSKDEARVKLGADAAHPTRMGLIGELFSNKLSPSTGLLVDYLSSKRDDDGKLKTKFGDEYVFSEQLQDRLYPMYISTLNEIWKEQPETVAGFLTAVSFFGTSVQTYESKSKNPNSITFKGQKTELTESEKEKYGQIYGEIEPTYIKNAKNTDQYKNGDDAKKSEVLKLARDLAKKDATESLVMQNIERFIPKGDEKVKEIIENAEKEVLKTQIRLGK